MNAALLRLARDENGQAMVLVAIFMVGFVAVAGLVADGGMVLVQRRDLQHTADAAAAAGAMQLDEATYRSSGGSIIALDPSAATSAAIGYLIGEDGAEYSVRVDGTRVEVEVSRGANTAFLRVLGITQVEINARSVAEPRFGAWGGP